MVNLGKINFKEEMINSIWKSKSIIFYMSIMDLKLKYKGTMIGSFWSILEPLAQLGILFLVFNFLYASEENFIIYLFNGLIMVHLFSRVSTQAMNSMPSKKSILLSLKIEKIIFPLTNVLTNIWILGIEVVIFVGFLILFNIPYTPTMIFFPLVLALLIILTTGLSLILSVVRVYFKDFQNFWSIITMALIFITPVFWYVKDMPENIAFFFLLNPLALLMEISHKLILFGEYPTINEVLYSIVTTFSILILGIFIFNKKEKKFVEML